MVVKGSLSAKGFNITQKGHMGNRGGSCVTPLHESVLQHLAMDMDVAKGSRMAKGKVEIRINHHNYAHVDGLMSRLASSDSTVKRSLVAFVQSRAQHFSKMETPKQCSGRHYHIIVFVPSQHAYAV